MRWIGLCLMLVGCGRASVATRWIRYDFTPHTGALLECRNTAECAADVRLTPIVVMSVKGRSVLDVRDVALSRAKYMYAYAVAYQDEEAEFRAAHPDLPVAPNAGVRVLVTLYGLKKAP